MYALQGNDHSRRGNRLSKKQVNTFRPVYPTPAAMITSVSGEGKPNIITLGEVFNVSLSEPPIVGIAIRKATYSHRLISDTQEFVINLPTRNLLDQTDYCGTRSGRDVDKFAETGLTAVCAVKVRPPLIGECPINLECEVLSLQEVGDHDLFLGRVLVTHVDESVIDEAGAIDYAKLDAFCFMYNMSRRGEYWTIGEKVSDAWFTRGR